MNSRMKRTVPEEDNCRLLRQQCRVRIAKAIGKGLRILIQICGISLLHDNAVSGEKAIPSNITSYRLPAPPSAPSIIVDNQTDISRRPKRAFFGNQKTSSDARHIADWIVHSGDNQGMPFLVVDKKDAKIFVFDSSGRIRGAAPALLGLARGDDSTPGIGERELSEIAPQERTTPAGRFVAAIGRNFRGEDVLWVDYEAAVSLHRVISTNPREHRLERLATSKPLDNRISYGCINVPVQFYENVVSPAFSITGGIVYVLPETRSTREVFGSYDIEERAGRTVSALEREIRLGPHSASEN